MGSLVLKRYEKKSEIFFLNHNTWKMGLFKVILLFPAMQNPAINGTLCVSCVLHILYTWKYAANSMTVMSPSRWHFGKCCCCSEGQKHVFLLSQLQKECETEKGRQRCVVTGLTPGENSDTLLLWQLQPCLLAKLSPETNMPRQMSLPTTRWILPARESPGSRGGTLLKSSQDQKLFCFLRFSKQKNISIFQKETFSIRRNTGIWTPNTCNSIHHMLPSPSCI